MREPWDEIIAALCGPCEELAAAALEQIVRAWEPGLLAYLTRHRGLQASDAHDSVQEMWCKVWLLRLDVKPERGFRSWVARIVENEATNLYRRQHRHKQWDDAIDGQAQCPRGRGGLTDEDDVRLEDELIRERTRIMTDSILTQLNWKDRLIVEAWLEGTDDAWITPQLEQQTGLKPKNLRVRLHRAKKRLRALAQQRSPPQEGLPDQPAQNAASRQTDG
jgi:RNA polymerase sigma factor (sigma-70 family)